MISYKDMTFCNASCGNMTCTRKLTSQVLNDAEVWWGLGQAPISISNFAEICPEFIEEKDYEQETN